MYLAASRFKYLYLAYLSTPACDRALYRLIRKQRVQSIVELGVGQVCRALRMIQVAQSVAARQPIRYTGIDEFELRPAGSGPGLSLKQAHRLLRSTGAKVQVVPGDPGTALARVANTLTATDLIVIAGDHHAEALARAWFYVPRMLHERSLVLLEERSDCGAAARLRLMGRKEIEALAAARLRRQAA